MEASTEEPDPERRVRIEVPSPNHRLQEPSQEEPVDNVSAAKTGDLSPWPWRRKPVVAHVLRLSKSISSLGSPATTSHATNCSRSNTTLQQYLETERLERECEESFAKFMEQRVDAEIQAGWVPARILLSRILRSASYEAFMGCIVLVQFYFSVRETDHAAQGHGHDELAPVYRDSGPAFLSIYCCELAVRFYVRRGAILHRSSDKFDISIVLIDVLVAVLQGSVSGLPNITVIRLFRLVRLTRALRILTTFSELYIVMHSFIGALKTIFWMTIVIAVIIAIWAIAFVEILHPLNQGLARSGAYEGSSCRFCADAYSSVFNVAMLLFQQIVTGDSWGTVSMTVIQAHPWTLFMYVPCFIMIAMGLMNLALAAIVDEAAEARKQNELERMGLKLDVIREIFIAMDTDGNGSVSLPEFQTGVQCYPEFVKAMKLLNIDLEDLVAVWPIMDKNLSGRVTYEDFSTCLYRIKSDETHMLLLFIKRFMKTIEDHMSESVKKTTAQAVATMKRDNSRMQEHFDHSTKNFLRVASAFELPECMDRLEGSVGTAPTASKGRSKSMTQLSQSLNSLVHEDLPTERSGSLPPARPSARPWAGSCEAPASGARLVEALQRATSRLEALALAQEGQLERLFAGIDSLCSGKCDEKTESEPLLHMMGRVLSGKLVDGGEHQNGGEALNAHDFEVAQDGQAPVYSTVPESLQEDEWLARCYPSFFTDASPSRGTTRSFGESVFLDGSPSYGTTRSFGDVRSLTGDALPALVETPSQRSSLTSLRSPSQPTGGKRTTPVSVRFSSETPSQRS